MECYITMTTVTTTTVTTMTTILRLWLLLVLLVDKKHQFSNKNINLTNCCFGLGKFGRNSLCRCFMKLKCTHFCQGSDIYVECAWTEHLPILSHLRLSISSLDFAWVIPAAFWYESPWTFCSKASWRLKRNPRHPPEFSTYLGVSKNVL